MAGERTTLPALFVYPSALEWALSSGFRPPWGELYVYSRKTGTFERYEDR